MNLGSYFASSLLGFVSPVVIVDAPPQLLGAHGLYFGALTLSAPESCQAQV